MTEEVHAIVEARMSSTRLPGKVLYKIYDKSVLELIVDRIKKSKKINKIIIATTTKEKDDRIVRFCLKNNINFFRGSESNVTKRVYDCAKKFNSKIIVQLTGDNPFIDHRIIDKALKIFKDNNYDFVTNNCFGNYTEKTANGMTVSIFKRKHLKQNLKYCTSKPLKEHSSLYFYREGKRKYNIKNFNLNINLSNGKKPRLTLDYREDFEFIKKIYYPLINKYGIHFSYKDIINFLNNHKKLLNINSFIKQKKPSH